jgi:thimet oligopeptidase
MRRPAFALLAFLFTNAAFAQAPVPANVEAAIKRADAEVAKLVAIPDKQRTFDNTVLALDNLQDDLNTATSLTIFLSNVSPDASVRAGARAAEEAVNNWSIELGNNEKVYRAVQALADRKPALDNPKQRLLDFTLRDYRRSGMALSPDKRARLAEIEKQIAKNQQEFAQNIAEDATIVGFTQRELEGLPASRLEGYKKSGDVDLVPATETDTFAVLTFVKSPETRHKMQLAYGRRGGQKNVDLLEQTLKLRAEQAQLLGYPNAAAYETEVRMAKNPAEVQKFYDELRPIVRRKAEKDYAEFLALKKRDVKGAKALDRWDVNYYRNKLKTTKYAVDEEKVAEYFPSEQVFQGLLNVASTLYGIEFKDITAGATELWHPDVKKVEVDDKATGKKLGTMYFDLFPRPNKYTHAACWALVGRRLLPDGTVQLPVSALVCNFTPPTKDKPSLLPHDEVETLFHEFGHGLHNILSEATISRFAGTSVERDFVEAPSQMFENWVWDPKVLALFAKHYKTGEPLPEKLLQAMIAAKSVGSGLDTEGQEFLGIVDQKFHTAPGGTVDTTKVWFDTQNEVTLLPALTGTYPQASFGHLMGGYQAGYYGYLWSKVYAADMFSRFEQNGLLNPEAGQYYRSHILAKGGSEDAMDMVRDYLGREPKLDAFLRELGLSTEAPRQR